MSDEIKVKTGGDLTNVFGAAIGSLNIKMAIFIFIMYLLLNSDVFLTRVLSKIPGTVHEYPNAATSKGTIILGTLLVILYIIADVLMLADIV